MQAHMDAAPLQEQCCKCMAHLAISVNASSRMVTLGIIKHLLIIGRQYEKNAALTFAIKFLRNRIVTHVPDAVEP